MRGNQESNKFIKFVKFLKFILQIGGLIKLKVMRDMFIFLIGKRIEIWKKRLATNAKTIDQIPIKGCSKIIISRLVALPTN